MNDGKKKLYIVTLDPFNRGGILSMMKFVYKSAKDSGFDVQLVYNSIATLRGKNQKKTILSEIFDGLKGIAIKRFLPIFEFLNYILNLRAWTKAISYGDIFFAVGGSNNCALPLVLLKKNFSIWVATPLLEDRLERIKKSSFLRKIREYFSLPFLLLLERHIFKKANKILALSNYTRNKIMEKYKINANKIAVVFFPIDINKFYPIEYLQRKNDYLLFTGRFADERKNTALLLAAFAEVKNQHPGLKLKLIGDILSDKLSKLLNELNLKESVEIFGGMANDNLVSYYQNAALFVVPSFQEGLCISALESLACGVPVISTRCGGPEDFIKDGYNGYLIENNNKKELCEAILRFLNFDNSKKKIMSENSKNYILKNHSSEKIWPKFLECFK